MIFWIILYVWGRYLPNRFYRCCLLNLGEHSKALVQQPIKFMQMTMVKEI